MEKLYIKTHDNVKLYTEYWHSNKDVTIVYVHGGPGQGSWDFRYAAEQLADKYNVVIFDQRGVLRSDAITDTQNFTSELLIDDVEAVRRHFCIAKMVLIGHSYGGELILRYAIKYPNNVSCLIYACPTFNFLLSLQNVYKLCLELLSSCDNPVLTKKVQELISINSINCYLENLAIIPAEVRNKVYFTSELPNAVKQVIFNNNIAESDWQKGNLQQSLIFSENDINCNYLDVIDTITVNSLLIIGEHDPVCNDAQIEIFKNGKNRQIRTIKNAGHLVYSENAGEFIQIVEEYLSFM